MPSCLSDLLAHNAKNNITMTPSEINKTVRRMNKLQAAREAERLQLEADKYTLDYSDDTGEIACGFKDNPFTTNQTNAARRLAA